MSTEQNKAIVQRYREAHNSNQLDRLDGLLQQLGMIPAPGQ